MILYENDHGDSLECRPLPLKLDFCTYTFTYKVIKDTVVSDYLHFRV